MAGAQSSIEAARVAHEMATMPERERDMAIALGALSRKVIDIRGHLCRRAITTQWREDDCA